VVRVWETSSIDVQDSNGDFDRAVVVDGTIDGSLQTDLPQAAAYARDVLFRRLTPPKVVRCTTREPGFYPYITATVSWSARLISADYFVDTVRVRAVGIDPAATTHELFYELEMTEGDALRKTWLDEARPPTPGIQWGIVDPNPALPLDILQSKITASAASAASRSVSFDTTPTVGSLAMVCFSRWVGTGGTPTVTDNQGNTYTRHSTVSGTAGCAEVWTAPIGTASPAINEFNAVVIVEIQGADLGDPVHVFEESAGGGGATKVCDLDATTVATIVFGVLTGQQAGGTAVPSSGWTLLESYDVANAIHQGISVIYQDAPAAGNYDPTWATSFHVWWTTGVAIQGVP
jgi:hypothetical protein